MRRSASASKPCLSTTAPPPRTSVGSPWSRDAGRPGHSQGTGSARARATDPGRRRDACLGSAVRADIPNVGDRARAVVIGGGVGGASIAYWLTRLGWNDTVLLERADLTSEIGRASCRERARN